MKLTWHIVAKDLRRMWPLLAGWLGLIAYRMFACSQLLQASGWDVVAYQRHSMLITLLSVVVGIVSFLLAAGIMLQDPVTGSGMFWATRPISGRRLLTAKVAAVGGLLIGLPLLINLAWGRAAGLPGSGLVYALKWTLGLQVLAVLLAMGLAALAGTTSKLLVWLLLAVALTIFVAANSPRLLWPQGYLTRISVTLGLLAVAAVGAVVIQFKWRRIAAAATWALGTVAAAMLVFFFYRPAPSFVTPEAVANPVESLQIDIRKIDITSSPERVTVNFGFEVGKWPAAFIARGGELKAELVWPDGHVLQAVGQFHMPGNAPDLISGALKLAPAPMEDEETAAHLLALARQGAGIEQQQAREAANRLGQAWISLPTDYAERLARTPPRCRLWFDGYLRQPVLLGEFPLEAGQRFSAEGTQVVVQERNLRERAFPKSQQAGSYGHCLITYARPGGTKSQRAEIRIIDRKGGRALSRVNTGYMESVLPESGVSAVFGMYWADIEQPRVWRTDRWVESGGSIGDLAVAVVAMRAAGSWSDEVVVERLAITP
jgi:hypothetical protein